ncbi:hypothetical protein SAMN05880558_104190 [Aeromonas sp. RU39B]|uniref:hypothetical protein n=1 Tax=Aeromonas sp. RU39B TaxID=1907416 RepID=UPI00095745F7|nr:hypothetical protein [Aeromonas sp. RU39B]SIQ61684.1 hypothetical protein SAMN05880558_104190 [Aeromonas sp. RU39B]
MQIAELKEIAPLLAGGIGAGATLIAVVVTSLFNLRVARLNIEAQSRQKTKELKIEKLEDLFFLFEKWQVNFSNIYLIHLRCYRGQLTFNEVIKLVNERTTLAPGEAQKYRMIMDLHFPSLVQAYAPVEAARKRLVPFLSDPSVSRLSTQEFKSNQVIFEEACEAFKSKVSSLAHETLELE